MTRLYLGVVDGQTFAVKVTDVTPQGQESDGIDHHKQKSRRMRRDSFLAW
jgi:hypothetical protein